MKQTDLREIGEVIDLPVGVMACCEYRAHWHSGLRPSMEVAQHMGEPMAALMKQPYARHHFVDCGCIVCQARRLGLI